MIAIFVAASETFSRRNINQSIDASLDTLMAEPHVVVTGDPGELLMVVFGRQEHARVSWEGDQASVERLHAANLGP